MDYLLAAHIQVTGGSEAAMQLNQVVTQINNFGTAARSANTGGMASDMEKAAQSGGALHAALGKVADAAIRMATYTGLQFLAQGLREAVSGVLDFDAAMTNSLSIQTGVTEQMRSQMENMAKSIAIKFGEMPGDVAKGFYYLASAGLNVEQQLADLPVVAAFAKAGLMDLDHATEMLFDSLTALGLKVADPAQQMQNLTHLADLLTEAAIKSQGTIGDFGAALSNKAGGMIKAFGLDLNESIGLLEVFADRGIKGAKGGEAFNQIIRDMALKATQHADAFKRLGIEVFDSAGNFNSLITIFQQVDAALGGLSDTERVEALHQLGFTQRNMTLIQGLVGTSGALKAFTADLATAGGITERVAETQMEALRSKLDQLKAVSLVFAIEGFGKLEEVAAWLTATFTPAVNAVVEVLKQLAEGARPVVTVMGGLVAGAVVGGLQELAKAVELVFSTIASHPGIVEALGASLALLAASSIVGNIMAIGVALGETLYFKALMAEDAINKLIVSMMTMDKATAIEGLKNAWQGLVNALNTPIVAGAAVVLFIAGIVREYQAGAQAAHDFADAVKSHLDMNSLAGINGAVREVTAHLENLREKQNAIADKGFWQKLGTVALSELDAITPGFFKFSDNLIHLKSELSTTKDELGALTQYKDNVTAGFLNVSEAINGTGMHARNTGIAFDETSLRMHEMGLVAQQTGVHVNTSIPALERLAGAAKIDLSADWHEWAPILEQAAIKSALLGDNTGKLDSAVLALSTDVTPFEDKLKAMKDVMEGLSGGMQGQFDATTKFSQSMQTLTTSMAGGVPTFNAVTAAGQAQRDALSGAADGARKLALAHAESTGSLEQGAAALQGYASGITKVMLNAGVSKGKVQELLEIMGLTPEQINTLFNVVVEPGKGATKEIQAEFENTAVQAANAALALDAFKKSLDNALGKPISEMEGMARASQSMNDLWKAAQKYVTDTGPLDQAFTRHTDAANAMQLQFASTAKTQLEWAQQIADNQGQDQALAFIHQYRNGIHDIMVSFGMSEPAIQAVLASLHLTDAALEKIKPGANIPVKQEGAEATGAAIDAIADKDRKAEIKATPTNIDPANVDLAAIADKDRKAEIYAQPTNVEPTDATLNNTARKRESEAYQYGAGGALVESDFNHSARARTSSAYQAPNTSDAEAWLNRTARHRDSEAYQAPNTSSAEAWLNYTARDRTSTVTVYTTSGNVYAGPTGFGIAEGGIVHAYAQGGFENHVAQIGRTGASRIWNEPETGGEAYIPLAQAKRARSLAIWEETGRMMGVKGGGGQQFNLSAPVNVNVTGAGDPEATAQAVASQVSAGVDAALRRVLIEVRSG